MSSQPLDRTAAGDVRPAHRRGFYAYVVLAVVVLVVVAALILANTRTVEVSWVFGSTRQALVWIVLAAAVLGWVLGLLTSAIVRHRRAHR